jgi:phage terminase large subunit GpA-like protein
MATCEVCGNDYWMSFDVHTMGGEVHTFDSIECAAQRIAPTCEHCQCRILGHGVEVNGRFFCCAHCARETDASLGAEVRDAVGSHPG